MPELKPAVKKNSLSPNIQITAYQLTPEEHADGQWHGAGIRGGVAEQSEFDFVETLGSVSSMTFPPETDAQGG